MPDTPSDTYLTLVTVAEGMYKEKGSKFIARAYPVQDEAAVKEIVAAVKQTYYDARHHCYAYLLGERQQHYRVNDDGEPGHSAGDPILGQIRSRNLTYVLVVVIRYFGGIKLGVSGLVHAYKTATAEALSQAQIVEKVVQLPLSICFDYSQMNAVMKVVKEYELEIISQNFAITCVLSVLVRKSLGGEVKAKLAALPVTVE